MEKIGLTILIILTLGIVVLSTLLLSSTGLAAVNTTTIAVNVSEVGQISVLPQYLEFIGISPGNNGTDQTITISNIGSLAFSTGVYASVNSFITESSNPLGGAASSYGAGSYLVLKNSSDPVYYFVNRMEWNDTTIGTVTGKDAAGVAWGFYRNKTKKWLWEIDKDNNNECLNTTSGVPNTGKIRIKTTDFSGSYDLSSNTVNSTSVGNTTEWGFWRFTSGPLVDYCVAVRKNCQSFMIYRWDKNSSLTSCSTTQYLNSSLGLSGSIIVTVNVFVPSGTPSGNATQSILTITAT